MAQNKFVAAVAAVQVLSLAAVYLGSTLFGGCLVPAALAAVVGTVLLCVYGARTVFRPLTGAVAGLTAAVAKARQLEVLGETQRSLDKNLSFLRDSLYRHGDPRLDGDRLFFGPYEVGASNDIVDEVQAKFGGAATIFLRDERVATNVKDAGGHRIVGSKLVAGEAYNAVYRDGRSFRGEVKVAEKPYVAIYEPIISGDTVIGALFVAVEMRDVARLVAATVEQAEAVAEPSARIATLTTLIDAIVLRNDEAMHVGDRERSDTLDRRRKQKALEREKAISQQATMEALSAALNSLAAADLSRSIDDMFPAEYERLRADFNGAIDQLKTTMRDVFSSIDTINSDTSEISSAADNLSRRTEQQAANLEETTAALKEITTAVQKTAKGAGHARAAVNAVRTSAEQSGSVVSDTVAAMATIEKSAREIAQIISVIDEIAFQTNLLALNAGVEAARAGDAGRGFAVVASEVRALAQRSAEAAKEIKTLIHASNDQVSAGVDLVGRTGNALLDIGHQITEISKIVDEIAGSAQDQASGLAEVNIAIGQMDTMTQQNAAMVEETTAATHNLANRSEELARLVGRFKLEERASRNLAAASGRGPAAQLRQHLAAAVGSW